MTQPEAAAELLRTRRDHLQSLTGRRLRVPSADGDAPPLPREGHDYMLDEVRDLYWNDLEWENVTEEERMEGGSIPELTFPGVLAYVRGLLLTEVQPDSLADASPQPDVVEGFLGFLAERVVELESESRGEVGEEGDRAALELRMTRGLLDRVLMLFHGIEPEDAGILDGG